MSKKFRLLALILIILAIPLTVFMARQVQNIINRAAGLDGKLALGISLWAGVSGNEGEGLAAVDNFARSVGQYPATFSIWINFGYGSTAFPSASYLDGLYARGITPVIFWQPVGSEIHLPAGADPNNPPAAAKKYSNKSIAQGKWDDYLRAFGAAAKAYGKPVIVRYAHEMNLKHFPWGEWEQGKVAYYNVGNTSDNYIAAWRHVHDYIRETMGATNIKFLWAPYGAAPERWYPGNKYVQYVGFDRYSNYGQNPNSVTSMEDLFSEVIKPLRVRVTGDANTPSTKPIIVAETGVSQAYGKAARINWLTNGLAAMSNNSKYPDLSAIIYFDIGNNYGLSTAEGIDPNNELLSTWAQVAAQPQYQGRLPPASYVSAPKADNPPTGNHDDINCNITYGWTCDSDNFNQPLTVAIFADGNQIDAVTANQNRSDLPGAGVCGGTANHGWSFVIPQSLKNGNRHNITAYAVNIGSSGSTYTALPGTPKGMTCSPPTPTFTPTPTPMPPPSPTTLSPSNGAVLPGTTTSTTLSWNLVSGASFYYVRLEDLSNLSIPRDSRNNCSDHYVCVSTSSNSLPNVKLIPGHSYKFWVHSALADGRYSTPTEVRFQVASAPTSTPTPTFTPTPTLTPTNTPTPTPPPSGSITANPTTCTLAQNQQTCDTTITWSTQNTPKASVYYSTGNIFVSALSGSEKAVLVNGTYTFILYNSLDTKGKELARVTVNAQKQSTVSTASPTNSPTISTSPSPSPQAQSGGDVTLISFVVGLDSIGTTGTNRVTTSNNSNKNPKHTQRSLNVEVFDSSNKTVFQGKTELTYVSETTDANYGKFKATVNLGKDIKSGNYTVKIKTDGFLRKEIPGIQSLKQDSNNTMPLINLVAGDINNDNQINILDYNILISCSVFAKTVQARSTCNSNSNFKTFTDLNDDGITNELDYGYFLQEYSVQVGD